MAKIQEPLWEIMEEDMEMKNDTEVLALDLEGTLISNAVSQFPRPGLFDFLAFCRSAFERVVVFTAVPEERLRRIAATLVGEGKAPAWFAGVEYIAWSGPFKDLSFIPDASVEKCLLVDDSEGYVHPEQEEQWVRVRPFASPYSEEDRDLERVMEVLRQLRAGMDIGFYCSPRPFREIRALFNSETIRVYQAFGKEIAIPALENQTFVAPFRFERITSWIKPSFLWTMKRTNWGQYCRIGKGGIPEHDGNTMVLGIDVERAFFDRIIARGQVTHFDENPDQDRHLWRAKLRHAPVLVQWDPEKTIDGYKRSYKAIQIGLRSPVLEEYARTIEKIQNMTGLIEEIAATSSVEEKILLLPVEEPYPVNSDIQHRLHMSL